MKNKGITIIALVITIVLMLILASVAVNVSINGGLFEYSRKAKLETEITELQEMLMKKQMINEGKISNGTINEILGIESDYNDKVGIEDGELVYFADKWTEKDIEILKEIGINESKSS
ncbi:MAG: Tfp pilus assembly protein FimT/FimU [Clostridia bacterium]